MTTHATRRLATGEIEEAQVTPVRRRQHAGIVVQPVHQREPPSCAQAGAIGKTEVRRPPTTANIDKAVAEPIGPTGRPPATAVAGPVAAAPVIGITLMAVPATEGPRQNRWRMDRSVQPAPLPGKEAGRVLPAADVRDGRHARRKARTRRHLAGIVAGVRLELLLATETTRLAFLLSGARPNGLRVAVRQVEPLRPEMKPPRLGAGPAAIVHVLSGVPLATEQLGP